MAAIDKIYLHSYDEYIQFRDWLTKQPKLKDKYGKEVSLMRYFFDWWDDKDCWLNEDGNDVSHPIYSAPWYVDAYIIKNCPLPFVQKAIRINYGYINQYIIDAWYDTVKHRTEEEQKIIDEYNANHKEGDYNVPHNAKGNTIPCWWMNIDDFEIIDGKVVYKKLEKSTYEEILDGTCTDYDSPRRDGIIHGRHCRMVSSPAKFGYNKINRPIRGNWMVEVEYYSDEVLEYHTYEKGCFSSIKGVEYLWFNYSKNIMSKQGTWDFIDEFVDSKGSSSCAYVPTIRALMRRIYKWCLPVGAKVIVQGAFEYERYEFVVTK